DRLPAPPVGAGQVVDHVGVHELGVRQVFPPFGRASALHLGDVDPGGVDALGGQGRHGVTAAESQFQRGGGVAEEFVARAVPVVLAPAEGVLQSFFGGPGVGLAASVAVPVFGGAGGPSGIDACAHGLRYLRGG